MTKNIPTAPEQAEPEMSPELAARLREHALLKEQRLQLERQLAERSRELEELRIRLLRQNSEQAESRQALQQLHQYHRLLLDSAAEGIYGVDQFGRCSFINRAALLALGYRREEVIGADIQDLVHRAQDNAQDEACRMEQVLRTGQGCHALDGMLKRKDGSLFAAEWSCHPIVEGAQITGAVVVFRDVTEARALAARLSYHASHDALTGLANRREFELRLERAVAESAHSHSHHVLLYLDLDQFKVVNDSCGHNAGDELLRQLATELQKPIRRGDILARLGGDEFGVLLLYCEVEQALPIAEKLLATVGDYRLAWAGQSFAVGVSIGVVGIDEHTEGLAQVLSAADSACYAAKEQGRNRIHRYQPDDDEIARRKGMLQWAQRLQAALEQDRFVLYAQTIRSLEDDLAPGGRYEILLRLRDADGTLIPPGAFLPAADRFDFTTRIDRWVVGNTLRELAEHPQHLQRLRMCSINLSAGAISDPGFLEFLAEQVRTRRIPADKLCFEITESAAVSDVQRAQSFILQLRELGSRCALDDFGRGLSSFTYLKQLPVDFLKIDGTLIRDILEDTLDHALTRSIRDIGHVMGKRTIAEFVESDGVMAELRRIGIDYAQGYGISRPRPLADLLATGAADDADGTAPED